MNIEGSGRRVWPGNPAPLGATLDGMGTNVSVFSSTAEKVELCLFDDDGNESRIDLPERMGECWYACLLDLEPGQAYGFRVHGPCGTNPACTSELVTNAVLHAAGPIELRAVRDDHCIRIEVADGVASPPMMRDPGSDDMGGRGLRIVDVFADRWGVDQVGGGKVVWFEVVHANRPSS